MILLHTLQVLYICTLCDSTNINMINEFVPNCLQRVSGDGLNGGSDSYLQFLDTCGKRRNIDPILDVTPQKEITWGCVWSVLCMTPTIILNNPTVAKMVVFFWEGGFLHQVVVKCSNVQEVHTASFFRVTELVSVDFEVATTYRATSPPVTPPCHKKCPHLSPTPACLQLLYSQNLQCIPLDVVQSCF